MLVIRSMSWSYRIGKVSREFDEIIIRLLVWSCCRNLFTDKFIRVEGNSIYRRFLTDKFIFLNFHLMEVQNFHPDLFSSVNKRWRTELKLGAVVELWLYFLTVL
jgi:hypothetical protein